ncbi:12619_t:CDS:2, partial [Racocetra persica]
MLEILQEGYYKLGCAKCKAVCHCKENCLSKRSACGKNNLKCSSRCHGSNIM